MEKIILEIKIPDYVSSILKKLTSAGYEAYIVGGCVRDALMGKIPNDYDVTTSAKPDEILKLFPNSLTIGLKHGTVTVRAGKELVEVTTYRCDGTYADHRHPDSVVFVDSLSEDLGRRDFTINAMAADNNGSLTDLYGGKKDLDEHIVRCVGIPDERFQEDALRMFRAYRFSSRFEFSIEEKTYASIKTNAYLSSALAAERIRDELEKVLLTNHSYYMADMINVCLLDRFLKHQPDFEYDFSLIDRTVVERITRWNAFCFCLIQYECITSTYDFLRSMKLDNRTVKCCCDTAEMFPELTSPDIIKVKHLLSRYGIDSCESAFHIKDALDGTGYSDILKEVIASGECYTVSSLDINGGDIMRLGFKGPEIKKVQNYLLDAVINNPDSNSKEILLSLAKDFSVN